MRLSEQVDTVAVFPHHVLDAGLVRQHPGPLDAPVCGPHQSDVNPTLDVSDRPIVGMTPLCCEASGYPFQGSRCLHTQLPMNGGDEGRKMPTLLEACLQVNLLLRPFCLQKTLFWCVHQMGICLSVHDTYVVNADHPILPEATD